MAVRVGVGEGTPKGQDRCCRRALTAGAWLGYGFPRLRSSLCSWTLCWPPHTLLAWGGEQLAAGEAGFPMGKQNPKRGLGPPPCLLSGPPQGPSWAPSGGPGMGVGLCRAPWGLPGPDAAALLCSARPGWRPPPWCFDPVADRPRGAPCLFLSLGLSQRGMWEACVLWGSPPCRSRSAQLEVALSQKPRATLGKVHPGLSFPICHTETVNNTFLRVVLMIKSEIF